MGKQESMDGLFQMAKDLAKAEKELKVEQWVEVTIYYGYYKPVLLRQAFRRVA